MKTPVETHLAGGFAQAVRSDATTLDDSHLQSDAPTALLSMTESVGRNGEDGDAFTGAYLIVVNSLTETLLSEIARAPGGKTDGTGQRQEVCAAVWATIRVALSASLLSTKQQQLVLDVLSRRLNSRWGGDLCATDGNPGPIKERSAFYLHQVDPQDPVTTAARIVEILFEAVQVPTTERKRHSRVLAGLIAHRMVSDVWLFNGWDSEGKLGPRSAGKS